MEVVMKKKLFLGALIGVMLLSVTGCGNSGTILTCTMEDSSDGTTMTQEWNVSFENDIATKMTSITKIEVNDEYEEQLDQIEESLKETDLQQTEGMKESFERDGNILTMTVEADVTKMTEEEKDDFGFSDNDDNSYDTVKENLESEGYTCK